ncbi:MAG: hypothetical protein P8Z35_21865 [Ignavibacteriaceae bacterium]
MKILAIEKEFPGVKEEQYTPHLKAEALKVWQLFQAEKIREFEGLIEFDILPLLPYTGFSRLFEKNNF